MQYQPIYKLGVAAAFVASALSASAATTTLTPAADTYVRHDGNAGVNYGAVDYMYLFADANQPGYLGYVRFDLSSLGPITITDASIQFTKISGAPRNDTLVTGRFALNGINDVVGNTAQNWDELSLSYTAAGTEKTLASGLTSFDDNVSGISEVITGSSTVVTVSGAPLISWLQGRVDGSNPGLVNFLLDFPGTLGSARGFGLATKENATEASRPVLSITYTPVPEPSVFAMGACGFALLMSVRRRK